MSSDEDRLTRAGWPRPIHNGWPIPWVSPRDDLGQMNGGRLAAAGTGTICAVCGVDYLESEKAYIFICEPAPPGPEHVQARAIDNAVMHERCARLALGRCPRLRQIQADGNLRVLRVTAHDAILIRETNDDGETVNWPCYFDIKDVEDVGTEVPHG